MRRHHESGAGHLFPEQCGGEVDGIERAELGGHRLRRPSEDDRIDVHQFQRGDDRQDRRATVRDLRVGEVCAQSEAIQRTQALGRDKRA